MGEAAAISSPIASTATLCSRSTRGQEGSARSTAKTYADWTCRFGLICEEHDNGEIWANFLWDPRERFSERSGAWE